MSVLSPPVPIAEHHQVDDFCSGVASLDDWLHRRAIRNEAARASRTYVLCKGKTVVGYYALASGAIAASQAPRKIKRNMPDPIPVIILGRLAIDQNHQGQGLGSALLRDALWRVSQAAELIGAKAVLVHAISAEARLFYAERGFIASPFDPMVLLLPLETVQKIS